MPNQNTMVTPRGVEEAMKEFAAFYEWRQSQSQKAVTLDYNVNSYGHGPGLFTPPMDPNVMNAMQLPQGGLEQTLPEVPTNYEMPLYGIITGQAASTDTTPPADDCGDWGEAGYVQLCRQYQVLGTEGISSRTIDLLRMGRFVDRADFADYSLIGDPFENANDGSNFDGLPGTVNPNDFMKNEFAKVMRELEVEATRRFIPDFWTAAPTNAADAFHTAWTRGMQLQINTGYRDAILGTTCDAADAKVYNFATASLAGNNISTQAGAGSYLVDLIADIVFTMDQKDIETGMGPVDRVFVMSRELFREVTAVWPCSYLTNRCLTASSANPNMVEATEQVRMREEMRAGKFLWVDGQQIPVIIDPTVPQTQGTGAAGAGTFTSDIWYVARKVRGGFPVLFKRFFNFNGPGAARDVIGAMGNLAFGMTTSPNGKYLFVLDKVGNCFKMKATRRRGLVCRTPYLNARITNVAAKPRVVSDNWNPAGPSFYVDGGTSVMAGGPSYYTPRTGE